MKEVTFGGCQHTGMVDDSVKEDAGKGRVMSLCPQCLAVTTVDDLFVGYPCGYRTQDGKPILAKVKEISETAVIVATSHASGVAYREWTVQKSDFRKKGQMLVADPFGTVK